MKSSGGERKGPDTRDNSKTLPVAFFQLILQFHITWDPGPWREHRSMKKVWCHKSVLIQMNGHFQPKTNLQGVYATCISTI